MTVVFVDTLAIPELDGRFLHNHYSDPGSDCRRLLGSTPATQWYKVHPCLIKTHEIAVFCAGSIRYIPSYILLDGRYPHSWSPDCDSVCGRLLGLTSALQWYEVRLCYIKTHESANPSESDLWTKVMENSMTDSSTTSFLILDLIMGVCWPRRQLHDDIRFFPRQFYSWCYRTEWCASVLRGS